MGNAPHFRTRARLLAQLGEQLIKTESIALQELIKNSYDADASSCLVQIQKLGKPEEGMITILDDGIGMDYDLLSNVWLEIGTSYKADLKKNNNKRSPKFNRLPLGEKGIGRLGVHRLGKEIEIITRMEGKKECRLVINWDDIDNTLYIEDLPIIIEEREPVFFKNTSGTQINIKRLKGLWDRTSVRECARSIMTLNSPFDDSTSFRVRLEILDSNWLDGLLRYSDVEQNKLFSFEAKLKNDEIIDFHYSFIPFPLMNKVQKRDLDLKSIATLTKMSRNVEKEYELINLGDEEIGTVIFKGVIFDLDTTILNMGGLADKRGFKNYLAVNGGVRVFRDNMRVWDYGEPENDWLELETRRVNQPALRISKRLIIGAVYLNAHESHGLIEKSNREGFMDNNAYQLLKNACRYTLERVELLRRGDKEKLRKFYGPTAIDEPLITSLAEAKKVIDSNIHDEKIVKEIHRYLDKIQDDYLEITGSLMKSAGAGLNLVIVIHQMQKILKTIRAGILEKAEFNVIEDLLQDLTDLVEGYSILVKKSDIKIRNIKGILEKIIFSLTFRFRAHGINVDFKFRERNENLDAMCSESHVMNAVMNLVDNSIWWMDYANLDNKTIFIDISSSLTGYTTILVADNGPGFTIPIDLRGQAFITAKPEGTGMGIGLHLTTQIMASLKGKILYPDFGDFEIPEAYKFGAIVALAFKNKKDNKNENK